MQKINKIKMIYTGGTIGMQSSPQGLIPDINGIQKFLDEYKLSTQIELVSAQPLIDSSALKIANWSQWIALINQDLDAYQGVIVLHGTDTLAYTAAMLSLVYSSSVYPIVITGAMLPLSRKDSDGQDNILLSIEALKVLDRGVVVVFNRQMLHPADCCKVSTSDKNAFLTPHISTLGAYTDGDGWQFYSNFDYSQMIIDSGIDYKNFNLCTDVKILNIFMTPSISEVMHTMILQQDWDTLILQSFGNGNFGLEEASKRAIQGYIKRDKPVLNVSQVFAARVDQVYALGSELLSLGCISGRSLTFEFCYAVTVVALSLFALPRMQTDWIKHILPIMDEKLFNPVIGEG